MRLTRQQREELKQRFGGCCAYCGDELSEKWHADHADPVYRQSEIYRDSDMRWQRRQTGELQHNSRDTLDNLMPSCVSCNIYKSVFNIEEFRAQLENTLQAVSRHACYKFAKKYGLIHETGARVRFHFENFAEQPPQGGSSDE